MFISLGILAWVRPFLWDTIKYAVDDERSAAIIVGALELKSFLRDKNIPTHNFNEEIDTVTKKLYKDKKLASSAIREKNKTITTLKKSLQKTKMKQSSISKNMKGVQQQLRRAREKDFFDKLTNDMHNESGRDSYNSLLIFF